MTRRRMVVPSLFFVSEAEVVYAIAVAEKACKPWIVEHVFNVLNGYSGLKVVLDSDAAS